MKKIIVGLTILVVVLCIGTAVLFYNANQQSEELVEENPTNEPRVVDQDGMITAIELEDLQALYPDQVTTADEAITLLQEHSNFTSYELTEETEDYYIITVTDSTDEQKQYVVYPSGFYFINNSEIILKNDGLISSPELAIMVSLDLAGLEPDDDYTYHISQYDEGYQVDIVSTSQLKLGASGVVASYAVYYTGETLLSVE